MQRGTKPDKEVELPGWLAQATKRVASTPTRTEVSTTAPQEATTGRLQSAVSGFKILVVEDNLINQKVMKRQLEARQCTVYTANNGKEAVEFIKSSSLNPSIGHEGPDVEICFMVGLLCTVHRVDTD
jgi:PleD family two-component response regulator